AARALIEMEKADIAGQTSGNAGGAARSCCTRRERAAARIDRPRAPRRRRASMANKSQRRRSAQDGDRTDAIIAAMAATGASSPATADLRLENVWRRGTARFDRRVQGNREISVMPAVPGNRTYRHRRL